jgi:hypothetical protein
VADGFWNHFLEISWKFLDLILVIVAVATRMSKTPWNRGKNWRQIMVSCSKWAQGGWKLLIFTFKWLLY